MMHESFIIIAESGIVRGESTVMQNSVAVGGFSCWYALYQEHPLLCDIKKQMKGT